MTFKILIVLGLLMVVTASAAPQPNSKKKLVIHRIIDIISYCAGCAAHPEKGDDSGKTTTPVVTTTLAATTTIAVTTTPDLEVNTDVVGGVAGATSQYDSGLHALENAFVDNPVIGWCSEWGLPQAIWKLFDHPVKVLRLTFQTRRNQNANYVPTKFDVFGSNNAECKNQNNWVILYTDDSGRRITVDETMEIHIPSDRAGTFRCYGIRVRDTYPPFVSIACLAHLKFYTDEATTPAVTTTPAATTTAAVTTTPGVEIDCEALGGVSIGKQCFVYNESPHLTWDQAVVACASDGGRLAVQDLKAVYDHAEGKAFWVGFSDTAKEGSWIGINGEKFDEQIPWLGGEPNNCCGGEDCLITHSIVGYNDIYCHKTRGYVCEFGISSNEIKKGNRQVARSRMINNKNISSEANMTVIRNPSKNNMVNNTNCTSPWVYMGNGSTGCILWVKKPMNWDSARTYCQTMGGDLPIFDKDYDPLDMVNYYKLSGMKNIKFWLGANDRSGSWNWITGNPISVGWKNKQSTQDNAEDMCMYTYTSGQHNPLINFCTHTLKNVICTK